jgi:hypothetical protein
MTEKTTPRPTAARTCTRRWADMRHSSRSNVPDTLKKDWLRWTDIVELFAHGRSARRRMNPQVYNTLYRRLIETCEKAAGSREGSEREYYMGLEDMVRPWLSLMVLAQADREIIHLLFARCRQVERELGGRRLPRLQIPRLPILLLPGLGALTALGWIAQELGAPISSGLSGWSNVLWYSFKRSSELDRLLAVNVVLVLISIFFVTRTARS